MRERERVCVCTCAYVCVCVSVCDYLSVCLSVCLSVSVGIWFLSGCLRAHMCRPTYRHTDGRRAGRQAGSRQVGRQTDRQTDRKTCDVDTQLHCKWKHADRPAGGDMDVLQNPSPHVNTDTSCPRQLRSL